MIELNFYRYKYDFRFVSDHKIRTCSSLGIMHVCTFNASFRREREIERFVVAFSPFVRSYARIAFVILIDGVLVFSQPGPFLKTRIQKR